MKILHLEASKGWGGQEIRILKEAQGMREKGHQIFFAVAKGGSLVEKARKERFTVYEIDFRRSRWILSFWQLLSIMKKHQVDLINTHSSLDSWLGGMAARWAGRPIVRTRHLSTPIKKGYNSRILYGKLADYVVTTCASIIPMICNQSGKKKELCRSVPTGVDPEKIRVSDGDGAAFREKIGVGKEDFLIGTACFMRSWKGIDDLLGAAALLKGMTSIKWVVIGGGHAERHQKRAKELNLDGIVFFTGHLENPFPALQALDVFSLLSTAHEGVSQAILQAAYLKKPLIATTTGGLGEVCIEGATGLTVPPFSPKKVAEAVLKLKENPILSKQFGKKAHERVLEQFTFSKTLAEMEEIFSFVYKNLSH